MEHLESIKNLPLGWRSSLTNSRRVAHVFALLVLFLCASAVVLFGHSQVVLMASYCATLFGGVAALHASISQWIDRGVRAWRDGESSSGGRRLISPTSTKYWCVHVVVLFLLSVAMYTAPSVFGSLDPSSPFVGRLDLLLPVLPAVGTVILAQAISALLAMRSFLGVGLSPEGVFHGSWGGCSFYSWDDIRRVEPGVQGGPGVRLWLPGKFEPAVHPGESFLGKWNWFRRKKNSWLPLGTLAVHPVVVYEALSFYRRHPELRHELGTEAGLERARRANYPDVIEELAKTGEKAPVPVSRRRSTPKS